MSIPSLPRRPGRRAFALLLLAGALSWCASAEEQYHILAKGETLYSVARKYGLKPEAIAKANSIEDPSKLKVGTKLLIPDLALARGQSSTSSTRVVAAAEQGQSSPTQGPLTQGQSSTRVASGAAGPAVESKSAASDSPAVAATHKVVKGDTLFSIARTYGVELSELRAANKLGASSKIKSGDTLKIPTSATRVGTAASQGSSAAQDAPSSVPTPSSSRPVASPPSSVPNPAVPDPVKTSVKTVRKDLTWPCPGEILYLEGKAYGVIIKAKLGEVERAVASGTVSSAGPYRGYGNVVFVLSRTGHIYVYGGNDKITVRAGDHLTAGQELGRVGMDLKQGGPTAYFLVFKNGEAVDPAAAPRD